MNHEIHEIHELEKLAVKPFPFLPCHRSPFRLKNRCENKFSLAGLLLEVAGAKRRWPLQFRIRGSRRRSVVVQLSMLGTGAHMHFREIDMRIEPLHDVIVGIAAGLAAIHERLDAEEGFDGISAREHAEPLFGLGFVAAQSYALGTVSDLNSVRMSLHKTKKEKLDCYACDTIAVRGIVTRIQLINATANYFKHHDEWARWPSGSDRGAYDTNALGSVGITEKTEFPCIAVVDLLCGKRWELIVMHQILKEWRAHLFSTLI